MDPLGSDAPRRVDELSASLSSRPGPATIAERVDDALVRLDRFRERPIVSMAAIVGVVGLIVVAWWAGRPAESVDIDARIPQVDLATTQVEVASDGVVEVTVHVSGAVSEPGVVTLSAGARVLDAVNAAGGATADADLHLLNLAAPLIDGVQIRVPAQGESAVAPTFALGGDSVDAADGVVNINTASAGELERLDGVGPSIAAAIVDHREENGPFRQVDDLLLVAGIGPAKLETIGDRAVVR